MKTLCRSWLFIFFLSCWQLPAIAEIGSWTHHLYFDHKTHAWWVQVSSTVPRVLTLTVNWHAQRGHAGVTGSFVLVVPAYPGFGAPVTAQKGVPRVHNFAYTIASD
jgi:hypothetical protein